VEVTAPEGTTVARDGASSSRKRVVVATRNRGKLTEILRLFETGGLAVDLVTIDEIAPGVALIEDEPTFEGNALAKARQAASATGLPALADDSGLEVDALGGAPGVRSARYAGEPSNDERNNAKLLGALCDVAAGKRGARFRCAAVYVDPVGGIEIVREGACDGEILGEPRGDKGFGYDPLFFVPSLGRSMAELTLDEKNRVSHRAAAFGALAVALTGTIDGAEKSSGGAS
jgi:XTP/dITP diphosphohydrolase